MTVLFDPLDPARFRKIFGTDNYPSYTLCARTQWLEKNPELARKVARAVVRGLRHLHDRPVSETVAKLPPEYQSAEPSVDIAVIERWRHKYSRDGRFPESGYDAVMRVTAHSVEKVRLANIDARTIDTNEFLENPVLKETAPNEFTNPAEGAKP
ncbi:MAG: ABC transporter substrate-binding protein [Bryobacterales bacterium]|nr:ABC transporter substrate-binding protein [Bryobacterales bacterium]